ncbi:Synembryn A [Echinococcus multilocularis]|uniref:Synembryn A n=1 Tax=Echinococcus multilocularis TaxID=6211 RepID=A0A068YC68_ECHMU|nr:Synembryn A [Echinococcus multilocularis]
MSHDIMDTDLFVGFRKQNENNFAISDVPVGLKAKIFSECKAFLGNPANQGNSDAIVCLLILSRDPDYQKRLSECDMLHLLFREAAILPDSPKPPDECIVGALKCLSNVIFKNPEVIQDLRLKHCLDALLDRCEAQIKGSPNFQIALFDLKVLFLCSALESASRLEILTSRFESDIFVNLLRWTLASDFSVHPQMFDITIETLKLLFNLSYAKKERDYDQRLYESTYRDLTTVIRELLVKFVEPRERRMELVSHSVNFLTSVPSACYVGLLFPSSNVDDSLRSGDFHTDPQVTRALSVLVEFLTYQLDQDDKSPSRSGHLLSPILTVMATASKVNRTIRKYLRMRLLPHLGADVKRLPETGNTLRNRLCSRLTAKANLDDGTVEAVALLIFILCKEKVDRAVKYSGFGNFVGFLSRHGLMAPSGGRGGDDAYSSASSDSETEDYRELKDQINPVTGRVEPPRCNPMEGLSDEQKEFEAMQLVNKIDQLQRSGLIQPGVVGEDGRVRPAEHVLELVQNISDEEDEDYFAFTGSSHRDDQQFISCLCHVA